MDLVVRIGATTQGFSDAMDEVESKTAALSSALTNVAKVSGVAWAGLSAAVGLSVSAFAEADAVQRSLENTIKASGNAAGVTADEVMKMSSSLQAVTTYGDEAITSGAEMLLTFNRIGGDTLPRATAAMLDMGTAMKMDVSSAAFNLGKALQEPLEGMNKLRSAGISFTDSQEEQVKALLKSGDLLGAQNIILTEVEKKYKGAAEAAAGGTGVFTQLKEVFGDLAEELGKQFAPALIVVAQHLKDFISFLKDNEAMVAFTAKVIAIGVAFTGIVTTLALAGVALLKINAAFIAVKETMMAFSLVTKGLIGATGIGLLLIVLGELYMNWESIWPKMYATYQAFVQNIGTLTRGLGKALIGLVTLDKDAISEGLAQMKLALIAGYQRIAAEFKTAVTKEGERQGASAADEGGPGRVIPKSEITALAGKPTADKKSDAAEVELEKMRRNLEEKQLLREGFSEKYIDLHRQEYEIIKLAEDTNSQENKQLLQNRYAEVAALKAEQGMVDQQLRADFRDQFLADEEEFQMMTDEQQEAYITENLSKYAADLNTEDALHKASLDKKLADKAAANRQYLEDERKFGKAYAEINKLMLSEKFQMFQQSGDEMAKMQTSQGNTLKAIGKVFAIKDVIVQTGLAAMRAYAGFATIPIVGPALGIAAAAAAIAFGAEQVGRITSAAQGGLMTGGIAGRDSIPTLTMPGELVVPRKNYNEVINAVANSKIANARPEYGFGGGGGVVRIEMSQDAGQFITARQLEDRELGILRS